MTITYSIDIAFSILDGTPRTSGKNREERAKKLGNFYHVRTIRSSESADMEI